ncbi:MAG: WecB/TagA/CpsF family glycosyltransferase [Anaerolineae bacterium]
MPAIATINLLGVAVSAVNMPSAVQQIHAWIRAKTPQYVCVSNTHSLVACRKEATLRQIHNKAGMVTPDGMPLVWLSHWAGQTQVSRVYGPDLLLAVCEYGQAFGFKHYFYGGAVGVADQLAARLTAHFPALQVVGTYAPPFRELSAHEDQIITAQIASSGADIVWVGLGMPKQEYWMSEHTAKLPQVLIGVGAAFDFHAGVKRQAPRWMQQRGLEWLFRLGTEPRRLWRRYLTTIPPFVVLALAQRLGLRQFPLDDVG